MSSRFWIGLPIAVMAVAPVFAVAGTAPAQASPHGPGVTLGYSCTGETWAGEALPTVTVQSRKGLRAAAGVAQSAWMGVAKFETIKCVEI